MYISYELCYAGHVFGWADSRSVSRSTSSSFGNQRLNSGVRSNYTSDIAELQLRNMAPKHVFIDRSNTHLSAVVHII